MLNNDPMMIGVDPDDSSWLWVGKRRWWGEYMTEGSLDQESEAAKAMAERLGYPLYYERRVFHVHFENGWTVSVIWGSMTYSNNHDHGTHHGAPEPEFIETPYLVEVAVLHKDHEGVVGGDVMGYCDADQVNFVCDEMSTAKTDDYIRIEGHLLLRFGVQSDQ